VHKNGSSHGLEKLEGILADDKEALRIFEESVESASKHFRWTH
jgi:hypothetical protein